MTATWTSTKSRAARQIVRARGRYQTCWRCSRELDLDVDKWHAGHLTDRALGGSDTDVQAECPRCNTRAGGRLGARIVNARRRANQQTDQRLVHW